MTRGARTPQDPDVRLSGGVGSETESVCEVESL